MKKFIAIQLAVFFITASFLYLYASTVFGASMESKSIIFMTPEKSYEIWDAVNIIEDLWVTKGMPYTPAMKQQRALTVKRLIALVRPYEELADVVKQLFEAYKNHNLKQFSAQKAKIAEMLAPVWREAILAEREKEEREQKKRAQMGWIARIKSNITQAMNNLYNYLFPAKKDIRVASQATSVSAKGQQQ